MSPIFVVSIYSKLNIGLKFSATRKKGSLDYFLSFLYYQQKLFQVQDTNIVKTASKAIYIASLKEYALYTESVIKLIRMLYIFLYIAFFSLLLLVLLEYQKNKFLSINMVLFFHFSFM